MERVKNKRKLEILVMNEAPGNRNDVSIPGYRISINKPDGMCEIKHLNKIEHVVNWYVKKYDNEEISLQLSSEDYVKFWDTYLSLKE